MTRFSIYFLKSTKKIPSSASGKSIISVPEIMRLALCTKHLLQVSGAARARHVTAALCSHRVRLSTGVVLETCAGALGLVEHPAFLFRSAAPCGSVADPSLVAVPSGNGLGSRCIVLLLVACSIFTLKS